MYETKTNLHFFNGLFWLYMTAAQKFTSPVKPALLGFHFALADYNSPTEIDTTSLSRVFKKGDIFNPLKQSSAYIDFLLERFK